MKNNWQTKKLGEICEIVKDIPLIFNGEKNYFSTGAIDNSGFKLPEKVTHKNKPSRANSYPKNGDVGFAKMKFTNKTLLIDQDLEGSIFSTGFCFLRPSKLLNSKYLFHFIISDEFQKLKDLYAGDGIMGGINNYDVKNIEISFPSIVEQKKIAKILNEVSKKTNTAKENIEKNLVNSQELLESYLQNIFINKGADWEEIEFGKIIELLTDYHANGSYKVLKANVELKKSEDYAWMVRSTDFENNFKNDKRYITQKSYDFLKKSKIFGNEIIICKIGNAGKVYLMPEIDRPCSLAMNSFLARMDDKKCSSEYIYRFLNSQSGREQIEARILGTTTKTITKDNVRSIKIPLPSIKEQKSIVKKLDALSGQTKKLEEIYKKKIADLDELKKSVLKKAFNGEL
ncbi:MAG: restriction endonuclease subunit S [Candidatus Moranbacteria bacterium]|nr:restriction endonuclease subunit S [Candidatus Moranbacteria bacterium]